MSISGLSGQKLGGLYLLKTPIAHGAHGVVYEAKHVFKNERYAIKVFHPEALNAERLARCRRDSDMAAALHHPGIVRVVDWSRRDVLPLLFMVSEFAEGESVQSRVRRFGKLNAHLVRELGVRVGMTLSAAHKLGVVHGGLTPRNLIYALAAADSSEQGEGIKVLDFGIAQLAALPWLLRDGLPYRAPEQDFGGEIDGRADQYALAAILYEALSGRAPDIHDEIELDHEEDHETHHPPPPLATLCPEAPGHLIEAIERAMSPVHSDRFPSIGDFVQALDDRGAMIRRSAASSALSRRSALSGGLSALSSRSVPSRLSSSGSAASPLHLPTSRSSTSIPKSALPASAASVASAASAASNPSGVSGVSPGRPLSALSGKPIRVQVPSETPVPGSMGSLRITSSGQSMRSASTQTLPGSQRSTSLPRASGLSSGRPSSASQSLSGSRPPESQRSLGSRRTLPLSGSAASARSAGSFGPVVRQGDGKRKTSPVFTGVGLLVIAVLSIYMVAGSQKDDRAASLAQSIINHNPSARPRPATPLAPVTDPADPTTPEPDTEETDAASLLTEAEKALDLGENVHAIELARGALPASQAWVIIGTAACRISDRRLGAEALSHLSSSERPDVETACRVP